MKMASISQVLTDVLCTTKFGVALIVQYFLFRNRFFSSYVTV